MDNLDENIDELRQKLRKANAESVRLSDYIARVFNDNERSTRMTNNKMERMATNIKILEGQLELAVNEKFKSDEKLMEVKVQRDDFERELEKLKRMYEKQEARLKILRQDIESMNEQKKDIFAKFQLVKNQEIEHDAAVGALKRQFQEKLCEFLNKDASRNEGITSESTNAVAVPANVSEDSVRCAQSTRVNQVTGNLTSNLREHVNIDEPNGSASYSMEHVSDHNRRRAVELGMRGRTQVVLHRLSMRKTSGTVIKCSTLLNTSTTSRVTSTETIETQERVEIKQQISTQQLPPQATVARRPRRTLKCTVCSKPYVSKPTRALCGCQYRNDL